MKKSYHSDSSQVLVGEIVRIHGVKGEVVVKTYLETPLNLEKYCPLFSLDNTRLNIKIIKQKTANTVIVQVHGVDNANIATNLIGTKLYALKENFPLEEENEYYNWRFIGVNVFDCNSNEKIGTIRKVSDFGGGPFFDICKESISKTSNITLPFTHDSIKKIDLENNEIFIDSAFLLFP